MQISPNLTILKKMNIEPLSDNSQNMPSKRELEMESDNSAQKAENKNIKQPDRSNQTQKKKRNEKNYPRGFQRILEKILKTDQSKIKLSDGVIQLFDETKNNKQKHEVQVKKKDLIEIMSLEINWKEKIKIGWEEQKKIIEEKKKYKKDRKKENQKNQQNQEKQEKQKKQKPKIDEKDKKQNINIPNRYCKYCCDKRNEEEYIPLNLNLYKVILQIYVDEKFPKDEKTINRRNVNNFFDDFFNSQKEFSQTEGNKKIDTLIVEIQEWSNKEMTGYADQTDKMLCEEDFNYIVQLRPESLIEFSQVIETSKQELQGFVEKLKQNNNQKSVRNEKEIFLQQFEEQLVLSSNLQNQEMKQSRPRISQQKKQKVGNRYNQISNLIKNQESESAENTNDNQCNNSGQQVDQQFFVNQNDFAQPQNASHQTKTQILDLLAKIKKGLNLVVTDETPILADYLEQENEDQNLYQKDDNDAPQRKIVENETSCKEAQMELEQLKIQNYSIPTQYNIHYNKLSDYFDQFKQICYASNFEIKNWGKKILDILQKLENQIQQSEYKLVEQKWLKKQLDFEQCLLYVINQFEKFKENNNLNQLIKESEKIIKEFYIKLDEWDMNWRIGQNIIEQNNDQFYQKMDYYDSFESPCRKMLKVDYLQVIKQ